jgi:hypothetical protein
VRSRSSSGVTNSSVKRRRERRFPVGSGILLLLAVILSASAMWWFESGGYTLYYGDAEAHLNIARRVWDNREPAYRELGTVWLPLPHVLMMPFTVSDRLWRNGLAGAIPSAICFVLACWLFFRSLRTSLESNSAAFAGATVLAWNPNLLYLQSIPMTEAPFLASLAGLLLASLKGYPVQAGLCTLAATLTRYEGWFLIPAVFLYFLLVRKTWQRAIVYGAIASVGPVYWLAHNWWFFGSATYFYDGPWSAKAIYARQLAEGMTRYPADGNWLQAWRYFLEAARLTSGETLLLIGIVGALFACYRIPAARWPVTLLAMPPLFYIWSLHASGTPIFIPTLWPHSYYNTRYALVLLPLLAFGVAAAVRALPRERRTAAAIAAIVLCLVPWITVRYGMSDWVCFRESEVNSEARREWTRDAARYMASQYSTGDGVWYDFGDLTGILRTARIPLRETLHDGNELNFYRTQARADLFLREKWVIAFSDSPTIRALARVPAYEKAVEFPVSGSKKAVAIYRRRTLLP